MLVAARPWQDAPPPGRTRADQGWDFGRQRAPPARRPGTGTAAPHPPEGRRAIHLSAETAGHCPARRGPPEETSMSSGPNAFSPVDLPPLLARRLQLLVDEHPGMSGGDCPACGDILPCRIGLDAQRQLDMSGCSAV